MPLLKPGELIRKLMERKSDPEAWQAASLLEKYRKRLEVDHYVQVGPEPESTITRIFTDEDQFMDAIACRDATIEQLEEK